MASKGNKQEPQHAIASPQLENGYTRIANQLLEALARTRLSSYEMSIILTVIRKTYGWHKTLDAIADSQFVEATGISRGHVWNTLTRLAKRKILIKVKPGGGRRATVWALQKDYMKWDGYRMLPREVAKATGDNATDSGSIMPRKEVAKVGRSATCSGSHKRNILKKEKKREDPPPDKKSNREKTISAFVKMFVPSIPGREPSHSDYPSQTALDDIDCMAQLWGDDIVQEAIEVAARTGKSKLGPSYVEAIIFRWKKERGIKPRITRREYDVYRTTR